jgi:hypothetical protein
VNEVTPKPQVDARELEVCARAVLRAVHDMSARRHSALPAPLFSALQDLRAVLRGELVNEIEVDG